MSMQGTIFLIAPFYNRTGFGVGARSWAVILHRAGLHVKTMPVDDVQQGIDDCDIELIKYLEKTPLVPPVTAVFFHVPSEILLGIRLPEPCRRIIATTFDGETPPPAWIQVCSQMDQVWLNSELHRDRWIGAGLDPGRIEVFQWPHPWIISSIEPVKQLTDQQPGRAFRFLTIALFLPRRRWDVLIQAYLEEFSKEENVELYLRVSYPAWHPIPGKPKEDLLELIARLRRQTGSQARIIVDEELGTRMDIMRLIDSCDVYVSTDVMAATAPVAESIYRHRPVIVTDDRIDEMPAEHMFIIPANRNERATITEEMRLYLPNHAGSQWLRLDVKEVRHHLRKACQTSAEKRRAMAKAAASALYPRVAPDVLINKATEAVEKVWKHKPIAAETRSDSGEIGSRNERDRQAHPAPPPRPEAYKRGISAIVHTLDEEVKIEDALKSLKGWVDEIIVCDMHSNDRTVEIARKYADKIIYHERIEGFDAARNFSGWHAEHEWVFYLDADERVPASLTMAIRQIIDQEDGSFDALCIPMDDRWMGRSLHIYESKYPLYKSPQLLRNGRFWFPGGVHEACVVYGTVQRLVAPVPTRDLSILHLPWDSIHHWMSKMNRYTDAEARKLDAAGETFHWRKAVGEFVRDFSSWYDLSGADDGAFAFWVCFNFANYAFYKNVKLHERHLLEERLSLGENEAPKDSVELFEYALQVARRLARSDDFSEISKDTPAPQDGSPDGSSWRQRFSCFHRDESHAESIRTWLTPYARLFSSCRRVLDMGCGPGIFLELLREQSVAGIGLDNDSDMVEACHRKGLEAKVADARTLSGFTDEFDGIHLGHIIEHMDGQTMVSLLESSVNALEEGGILLVRTPNWENEAVRNGGFWQDHTHVRPYPLELLSRIFTDLGLEIVFKGYEPAGWNDTVLLGRKSRKAHSRPSVSPVVHKATSSSSLCVAWEGSQFVYHSLALINRELCLQLIDQGHFLALIPYEPDQFAPGSEERFSRLVKRINSPLPCSPDVHVRHQWPPNFTPPPAGHWVIIQPWEYGRLPQDWIEPMNTLVDEFWVPSRHVLKTYVSSGIYPDRVHVVPNGFNPTVFHPRARPATLQTNKRFKFLFVGGALWRKGIDVLLKSYLASFRRSDDVVLVIKDMGQVYSEEGAWEQIGLIQRHAEAPEVLYLTDSLTEHEVAGLYTACDCLVHPYRGEGFGLPVLEAMACGLPVVVTAGGATDDFCSPEHALLIPSTRRTCTRDIPLAGGVGWVLEPDFQELARLMRQVYESPAEARARAQKALDHVLAHFTWEKAAEKVLARMHGLVGRPIRRLLL